MQSQTNPNNTNQSKQAGKPQNDDSLKFVLKAMQVLRTLSFIGLLAGVGITALGIYVTALSAPGYQILIVFIALYVISFMGIYGIEELLKVPQTQQVKTQAKADDDGKKPAIPKTSPTEQSMFR